MKIRIFIFSAAVFMAACNSTPQVKGVSASAPAAADVKPQTTEPEIAKPEIEKKETVKAAPAKPAVKKQTAATTTTKENNTATTTTTTESDNTAKAKKGWSKTAKGAVIGGVVGAGTGAVINKNNRAKGAVVGGVIGAGTGAIIGRDMDKKDGRH